MWRDEVAKQKTSESRKGVKDEKFMGEPPWSHMGGQLFSPGNSYT